jgi:hypothetical protein
MKKNPPDDNRFTNAQVGVLIEEMDKRYVLLAEGQADLRTKFEGMCVNQARTLESITQIKFGIKSIDGRLDRLESART